MLCPMSLWADALQPRPQHDALCASILAMARAAGARLAVRDAADGFIRLAHPHRAQLQQRGEQFAEHVAILLAAWRLAEAAPGGAALARLGAIATRAEERVLLCLCAAPELDRAVARAFRNVAHPGTDLTIGAVLDLASTAASSRVLLTGLYHPDAPLRRAALITTDLGGAALASMRLAIAPSVLAALRGEPIAAPDGAEPSWNAEDAAAATIVARLGLVPPRPGTITILTGPRRATAATLRLLMLATGRAAWLMPGGARFRDAATDHAQWRGWARDAALADGFFVAELGELSVDDTTALARVAATATGATLVLTTEQPVAPAVGGPRQTVVACAALAAIRAADGTPVTDGVGPGPLRRALDALAALV